MGLSGAPSQNVNIENAKSIACLSQAVFQEASNQSMQGKIAVANVINNRVKSEVYPDSICAVIKQKGQFSFIGHTKRINEKDPKVRKQMEDSVAASLLVINEEVGDNTFNATAFVNLHIATSKIWLKNMKLTTRIQDHSFFKQKH
jgi:spore germination cell wall hydrolase CwlJ-like protein